MHYSVGHKNSAIKTIKAIPKDGGSRPDHVGPKCLYRAAKKNRVGRLRGCLDSFGIGPPSRITASAGNPASGRYVHPQQDRGLIVREAALLQGFPREYWFVGSLDQRSRQIGNAVPTAREAFLAAHMVGELLAEPAVSEEFDPGIKEPVGPSFSRLIPALKAGHRRKVLSNTECLV